MTTDTKKPQDLDAFDGNAADDDEAAEADADAVARIESATGATSGDDVAGFEKLEMQAVLQDAKVSAASNGDNYDLTFELDIAGFVRLAVESAKGKGAFAAIWNKIHIGDGAELKRFSATRDADGEMHYKLSLHLPQSEISRSLGRMGSQLRKRAQLTLEPSQGTLPLADGTQVDLTKRADD